MGGRGIVLGGMTPRHLDLFRLAEFSVKEQARRLFLSEQTVKNYRSEILGILEIPRANGWTLAVTTALRLGFVTLDEIEKPPRDTG